MYYAHCVVDVDKWNPTDLVPWLARCFCTSDKNYVIFNRHRRQQQYIAFSSRRFHAAKSTRIRAKPFRAFLRISTIIFWLYTYAQMCFGPKLTAVRSVGKNGFRTAPASPYRGGLRPRSPRTGYFRRHRDRTTYFRLTSVTISRTAHDYDDDRSTEFAEALSYFSSKSFVRKT